MVQQEQGLLAADAEVRYAQTRSSLEIPLWSRAAPRVRLLTQKENDNLRHEYVRLFSHVQRDIPFARIALQKPPEAINLWIGNSRSVTALHKDNYENIYVQVLGQKHFVLLPSLCSPCVSERSLRPATYARRGDGRLELRLEDGDLVPFATWDPDEPAANSSLYSHLASPLRVTLNPGDMLYLPAMWCVTQTPST